MTFFVKKPHVDLFVLTKMTFEILRLQYEVRSGKFK